MDIKEDQQVKDLSTVQLLEVIKDRSKIVTTAGDRALARALENVQLLDSKQQDYGSRNISDFGEFGVIVRLNDKIQRLRNLHIKGGTEVKFESVKDTWQDISNYGLIGMMLCEKKWPNE